MCRGRPFVPESGFLAGCWVCRGACWFRRRFGKCSLVLSGLLGGWGVMVVVVSCVALSIFGGFAWVFHAFALLKSSASGSLSGWGADACISAQRVCRAVSSIPVWSVLEGPWVFGVPFVSIHTVIVAGAMFSGGSFSSHGPLKSFCFSTVRIVSLLEVISIISVVGHMAWSFVRF